MTVRIDVQGPVTMVAIDRPEVRNAVDGPTAEALAEAFRAFDADPSQAVAILSGTDGHFCAGADLKAMTTDPQRANRVEWREGSEQADGPMGPTRMTLDKPVIAAVEGYAVAGGLELALWCDLRVAGTGARLGFFDRRWGVPLIDGGTIRLPRLIGHSRAMDLLLTGREVGAQEALDIGLVNRIVDDDHALEAAMTLANEIARFPQNCMRSDRRSAIEQWDLDLEGALENEFRLGMESVASGETGAGAARFTSGHGRHGDFEDI